MDTSQDRLPSRTFRREDVDAEFTLNSALVFAAHVAGITEIDLINALLRQNQRLTNELMDAVKTRQPTYMIVSSEEYEKFKNTIC